ncbi:hypothetical protein EDB80DRAFT_640557 [Ilyonectria destructans]|nr:hypothetical protein EDB80DRAFT_640557 [Ilyonectria destructans]
MDTKPPYSELASSRVRGQYSNTTGSQYNNTDTGSQYINSGCGIQYNAQTINLGTNPEGWTAETSIRALLLTNPRDDMKTLKRNKGPRSPGTCEWILNTKEFNEWLGSRARAGRSANVLSLYGYPGRGKSTMAIFLAETLSKKLTTEGNTVAYFFCDSSFHTRRTATSVLRGIIWQLADQHPQLVKHILPRYRHDQKFTNSFDTLWGILMEIAADETGGRKFCILDALDECDPESQQILLKQLHETFQDSNSTPNLSFLITSRPHPDIQEYLQDFVNKDIASFSGLKHDISRYINAKVSDLARKKKYTDHVKTQVCQILKEKAEGTFLWVGLACEQLSDRDVFSKDAIAVLQALPNGLSSLYKKLLHTALDRKGANKNAIRTILSFVAVSIRPFTIAELSEACDLHQEQDLETRLRFTQDEIASCHFLVVEKGGNVVVLHQSVKDFLFESEPDGVLPALEAHARLAFRCIDQLMQVPDSNEGKAAFYGRYLLSYAAQFWPHHAHLSKSEFKVQEAHDEFFATDSPYWKLWMEKVRRNRPMSIPEGFTVLHAAGRWGIPTLIGHVHSKQPISEAINVNCAASNGTTPIDQAVGAGHVEVIDQLLDHNAIVSKRTFRILAKNKRHGKAMMRLILDRQGDEISIPNSTIAALAINFDTEMMRITLHRYSHAIVATKEVINATAENSLHGAATLRLLLDRQRNKLTINDDTFTALAYQFDQEIVRLFLNQQGDRAILTTEVIEAAARNRRYGEEVMRVLLNLRGEEMMFTSIALEAAVGNWNHCEAVVRLLVNQGQQEMTITEEVVEIAAENWDSGEAVIRLLIEGRKGRIAITDEAVASIARNFGGKMMGFLLDRRGDAIDITEEVVEAAVGNERSAEVLKVLLDRREDKVVITEEVVEMAAGNENNGEALMELLLDRPREKITMTEGAMASLERSFEGELIRIATTKCADVP